MRADKENHFGVGVIGAGTIEPHPKLITFAAARRTNVCMRVVTVNTPGGEYAFSETVFARPPNVVHDLIASIFNDRFPNARCNIVKRCVPGGLFPFTLAAFAGTLQRIKNAIGIMDLIKSCRTLGAVAPPRSGMLGIAFEL